MNVPAAVVDAAVMASPASCRARLLEQGGFAEYVCVPERLLARKPGNLSYEEAAAVPMAAATALLGLREVGRTEAGQQVLVNGVPGKVVVTI